MRLLRALLAPKPVSEVPGPSPDQGPPEWTAFRDLLLRHRVYPALAGRSAELKAHRPPGWFWDWLKAALAENQHRSLLLASGLVRVDEVLGAHGLTPLAFKGVTLARQYYGDPAARPAGDVDLLLEPEAVAEADLILRRAGYVRVEPREELTPRRAKAYRRLRHHYSYRAPNGVLIELHWRPDLLNRLAPVAIEELRSGSRTVDLGGRRIAVLNPIDLLILLVVHGAGHGWDRLSWLLDLVRVAAELGPEGLAEARKKSAGLGLALVFDHGLGLAAEIFGPPDGFQGAMTGVPSRLRAAALGRLSGPEERPRTMGAAVAELAYRWRLKTDSGYRLELLHSIAVSAEEWRAVDLPDRLFPLLYLLRPYLWFRRRLGSGLGSGS